MTCGGKTSYYEHVKITYSLVLF